METYFQRACKHELLPREAEVDLAQRIEKGDAQAREKMILSNLRLAISIARRYQGRGCDLSDLIQEANLGLVKAVERFDWRRGYKFSTYATWWIKQSVNRHVSTHARTIRMPSHTITLMQRIKAVQQEYSEIFGNMPTVEEISSVLNVKTHLVAAAINANQTPVSLHNPSGDDNGRALQDVIPDPNNVDPSDVIDHERFLRNLKTCLSQLTPREEIILRLRFGIAEIENTSQFLMSEEEAESIRRGVE